MLLARRPAEGAGKSVVKIVCGGRNQFSVGYCIALFLDCLQCKREHDGLSAQAALSKRGQQFVLHHAVDSYYDIAIFSEGISYA